MHRTWILLGFIEELLFRGAFFGVMRRETGVGAALVSTSVVFALAHFLQSPRDAGEVQWFSGFQVIGQMFATGPQAQNRAAQFINLTLGGILLAMAYHRTANLWFSIGLPGGWIFWLKLGNQITRVSRDVPPWLWGTRKVIDGWAATLVLLAAFAVLPQLTRRASHSTHAIPGPGKPQNVG